MDRSWHSHFEGIHILIVFRPSYFSKLLRALEHMVSRIPRAEPW